MAKDRFWFEHDSNAHSDPLIIKLRMKFGLAGYGAFWMLVEALRDADGYRIEMSMADAICFEYRIDRSCFDFMVEIGLFKTDSVYFWSNSLMRRMEEWDAKRDSYARRGAAGGRAKAENKRSSATAQVEQSSSPALPIREQNITEENTREEEEQLALLPPTPKQKISRACQLPEEWKHKDSHVALALELGVGIEIESVKFREHAIATGRTMKNWDMAFNTWLRRSAEFQSKNHGRRPTQLEEREQISKDLAEWARQKDEEDGQSIDSKMLGLNQGIFPWPVHPIGEEE